MIKCRGMKFRDEDDAYEYFRQREIDDEDAARWPFPAPHNPDEPVLPS